MVDESPPPSSSSETTYNNSGSIGDNDRTRIYSDMRGEEGKSREVDENLKDSGNNNVNGDGNGDGEITGSNNEAEMYEEKTKDSAASEFHPKWWKFKMRGYDDDLERDWWFASTAIPLLAATITPLANVTSIAALVTYWRENISDGKGGTISELDGTTFRDPRWCYWLNLASLICGFIGNIFLLFNFTNRVRYIIALPVTIFFFYVATWILVGITLSMHIYQAPVAPYETYTQGYWYAVISAAIYFISAQLLMVNMWGYFTGHYPQQFDLTDSQRTLILQTMLFFVWLAGGGGIFSAVEQKAGWSFVDGLYFCDVTILTVGFGDLYPMTDTGRGLVFPYSVGGIIMLGLMISSIAKFAGEISEDKVIKKHVERTRNRTMSRAISEPEEIRKIESRQDAVITSGGKAVKISSPSNGKKIKHIGHNSGLAAYNRHDHEAIMHMRRRSSTTAGPSILRKKTVIFDAATHHVKKMYILRDEKDRFDIMRKIQYKTHKFKRWYALTISTTAFGILWCAGAIVFWQCEKNAQGMTYFQGLYFCYVSLLTIGYGDLAPKSNGGRCFFVVWSLIAVPTMTILINDLGSTVISSFKRGTFRFADFTLLPKKGVWREWVESHPTLYRYLQRRKESRESKKRLKEGMKYPGDPGGEELDPDFAGEEPALHPDLSTLEKQVTKDITDSKPAESNEVLARRLAVAIRSVATDMKAEHEKRYSFEEWAEITRLIRFTSFGEEAAAQEEENEGVLEWDWLGENSPMMVGQTEPEFVLDRLCESLGRYMKRVERAKHKYHIGTDFNHTTADDAEKAGEEDGVVSTDHAVANDDDIAVVDDDSIVRSSGALVADEKDPEKDEAQDDPDGRKKDS